MALAVTDLVAYRHRSETKREQDLRVELASVSDHVTEMAQRLSPHMHRLWLVCREIGPAAMQSWSAVSYEHGRLIALVSPESEPAA